MGQQAIVVNQAAFGIGQMATDCSRLAQGYFMQTVIKTQR